MIYDLGEPLTPLRLHFLICMMEMLDLLARCLDRLRMQELSMAKWN